MRSSFRMCRLALGSTGCRFTVSPSPADEPGASSVPGQPLTAAHRLGSLDPWSPGGRAGKHHPTLTNGTSATGRPSSRQQRRRVSSTTHTQSVCHGLDLHVIRMTVFDDHGLSNTTSRTTMQVHVGGADNQRIEDLRRRVQKDPASIAFAQLAEELRRNGDYTESVDVCRTGLAIHPATSPRASRSDARCSSSTNWTKRRPSSSWCSRARRKTSRRCAPGGDPPAPGLGHRRPHSYRSALLLAKNDPDLQQTVDELSRKVEPQLTPPAAPAPHPRPSSHTHSSGASHSASTRRPVIPGTADLACHPGDGGSPLHAPPVPGVTCPRRRTARAGHSCRSPLRRSPTCGRRLPRRHRWPTRRTEDIAAREKAVRTIAALEQWLEAIHVARAQRRA